MKLAEKILNNLSEEKRDFFSISNPEKELIGKGNFAFGTSFKNLKRILLLKRSKVFSIRTIKIGSA